MGTHDTDSRKVFDNHSDSMKKARPPGPQSIEEVVGSPAYDPLRFVSRMVDRYGDYSCYDSVMGPVHLVNDPQGIHQVLRNPLYERKHLTSLVLGDGLITSQGPYWRQQRKLIQPHLSRHSISTMVPSIVALTERMLTTWRQKVPDGPSLNVAREINGLTRDVVLRVLFSVDLGADGAVLTQALDRIIPGFGGILGMLFQDSPKFSPEQQRDTREALSRMDEIMYSIIEERRRNPDPPNDLLTGLLRAVDETGKPLLTDRQVRDEMITMVVAGHETTAISLAWTSYLLTLNFDQQEAAQQQIGAVLGDNASLTLEDVVRLQGLQWMIKEALRLYPPSWQLTRLVLADNELGGYPVKSGDKVVCCIYTTHRHPGYWSEPERYQPERFKEPNTAYLPFGFGGHVCVGQYFGLLEGVIILAMILREFEFCSVEQETVTPEPLFTLRIKDGLRLRLKLRS